MVQNKINKKSSRFEDFRFHLLQAMSKHSFMLDKYDTGKSLDLILNDKLIDEKYKSLISRIQDIIYKRCQELLADSIALSTSNPEGEQEDFKQKHLDLRNKSLETLLGIDKELSNKPLTVNANLRKDMNFWNNIKMWLYAIGGSFFIGGTILQILSLFYNRSPSIQPM
jgi:hypothetical protein